MPSYTYEDQKTFKQFTLEMTISEMERFEKENSNFLRVFSIPRLKYRPMEDIKIDGNFKERLEIIKKNTRGSNINIFKAK